MQPTAGDVADAELEAALGYQVLTDIGSASTPYTTESRCSLHVPVSVRTQEPWYCSA